MCTAQAFACAHQSQCSEKAGLHQPKQAAELVSSSCEDAHGTAMMALGSSSKHVQSCDDMVENGMAACG